MTIQARFRLAVVVAGAVALSYLYVYQLPVISDWRGVVLFSTLLFILDGMPISMPVGLLHPAFAAVLPLFLFYGLTAQLSAVLMSTVVWGLIQRKRFSSIVFNLSQFSVGWFVAALGYQAVTGQAVLTSGPGLSADYPGMLVYVVSFMLLNHFLVGMVVTLGQGPPIFSRLIGLVREPLKRHLMTRVLTTSLGVALAHLYELNGLLGAVVIAIPIVFSSYIFRLHFWLRTATAELKVLLESARRFGSGLELGDLFDTMADSIKKVTNYDSCVLYLWDEVNGQLQLTLARGNGQKWAATIRPGQGIIGRVARHLKPELIADVPRDWRRDETVMGSRSLLVVPMIAEGEPVGVLVVSRSDFVRFTTDHLRLVTILASQAAIAIEHAILYRRTERLSTTDALTGLHNYRHLTIQLGAAVAGARADGTKLSLIYLDIDRFKQYNDTHGHLAGDSLLVEFADVLREAVRSVDTPIRYAGDEFIVILPGADASEAARVATRIRDAVSAHTFLGGQGINARITVSAGIATLPDGAATESELISQADAAMYRGKKRGPGNVVMAGMKWRGVNGRPVTALRFLSRKHPL